MGTKEDLKGKRFGRLTVVRETSRRSGGSVVWLCKCDCGTLKGISAHCLKSGRVLSCGCYNHDAVTKHGMGRTRLHGIWCNMRYRCENPKAVNAADYGGRGIKVCDEWSSNFEAFRDWALANGYSDDLTIDRIDNNGNYEPSNCRWTTLEEQGRNKRNNVWLTCNGETHILTDWARMTDQPKTRLWKRRKLGWSDEEIVFGRA